MKTIKNLKAEEIRKSILQLAIQGKLVKQDSNDEPASELVKRIYAEKQKLIQEGKIKKDKNESFIFKGDDNCYYEKIGKSKPIKLEDLPFDIPDNWTWVRINNYVQKVTDFVASGSFASLRENVKYYKEENYALMIKTQDFQNNFLKDLTFTDKHGYEFLENSNLFGGELVLANVGSIGKVFIVPKLNRPMTLAPNSIMVRFFNDEHLSWLLKLFQSSFGLELLLSISSATAIKKFNKTDFKTLLIPLPPLEEQQRIVEKINSFEPLIQEYDKYEKQLTELESTFVEKLKKSILQYAIEGKLVKQDPNDEPASVLLERIKVEKEKLIKEGKIKRDKDESYIYQGDDKNYYENLPQGWCICTLNNLATYKKGPFGSSLTKGMFVSESTPNRVKVYEQKNAIQHDEKIGSYFISENKFKEMQSFEVNPLDFIVSCAGTIGEIFKLPLNASKGIINQALMKVTLINESISDYFEIIFYDALHKLSEKSKGTAIKNIAPFEILKPALIQLPPLDEQQRILEKLNIIATLIDC